MTAGDAAPPPIADWRGFHEALRRAAIAATRGGTPLALLMVEVPEVALAALIRIAGAVGEEDALARYGSERLAIVMAETDLAAALARAERLGLALRGQGAIGVAQFHDEEALGHLIERAQAALAQARAEQKPAVALARALPERPLRRSWSGRDAAAAAGSAAQPGCPRPGSAD